MLLAICNGRTHGGAAAPLVALAEVVHGDCLLPMIDTVAVLRDEWGVVLEKVAGHVGRYAKVAKSHYVECLPCVKEMVMVLFELWSTMRQCEDEKLLHLHLTHTEYARGVRKELHSEMVTRLIEMCWKLSTHLLRMQLQLKETQAGRRASDLAAVGDAEQARVRIVTHAAQLRTAPPLAALKEEVGGDGKGRRRGSLFGWIKRSTKNLFG